MFAQEAYYERTAEVREGSKYVAGTLHKSLAEAIMRDVEALDDRFLDQQAA
jgi:hypothetical protein